MIRVLDLFSAAAGGWSLGMHRAGFTTMAACEFVDWRRALYSQNNPGVPVYDDVRTLSADRLVRDGLGLPDVIVGSPPCQDISSANTKGKGVEGERSGLYFEAVRIIGECRPRWFALENSSNLRTRGADAVLAALEALGYACWTFVVRAGDIGANHERPRSWIIGCDLRQVADTDSGQQWRQSRRRGRSSWAISSHNEDDDPASYASHPDHDGQLRSSEHAEMGELQGLGDYRSRNETADTCEERSENGAVVGGVRSASIAEAGCPDGRRVEIRDPSDADQAGQANGCLVSRIRQAKIADDGCGAGRGNDRPSIGQMAVCSRDSRHAEIWRSDWSLDDLADHLQLDDGLSAWVAGTRVAVGGPKGTSAASLIVEAFGDAVVPQIPEAIGLAILRTERALAEIYGRVAA